MTEAEVLAAKVRLRAAAQRARAGAWRSFEHAAAAARALADSDLGALMPTPGAIVSGYLAMREELDPGPLMARLEQRGCKLALPVVPGKGVPLLFRSWRFGGETVPAGFGTREPPPDRPVVMPDLLLVPLLAFDRQGFRLGYGGGYYDRTLRALRSAKPVRAIGIAFAAQEVDAVPHLDYDERLDAILTPRGLELLG